MRLYTLKNRTPYASQTPKIFSKYGTRIILEMKIYLMIVQHEGHFPTYMAGPMIVQHEGHFRAHVFF